MSSRMIMDVIEFHKIVLIINSRWFFSIGIQSQDTFASKYYQSFETKDKSVKLVCELLACNANTEQWAINVISFHTAISSFRSAPELNLFTSKTWLAEWKTWLNISAFGFNECKHSLTDHWIVLNIRSHKNVSWKREHELLLIGNIAEWKDHNSRE